VDEREGKAWSNNLGKAGEVKWKVRDPGDADEISVEGEHSRSVLESDGCDQRVNRRQRDPLCAPLAKDGGGIPVRRESTRLQHFPLREVALHLADVPGQTLQNLCDDDTRQYERF
jgi:hypothetical protein